ncbi:hypothetical protein QQX09_04620 [Demequina sp. SYSU T00192]|uniref:ABC transporter permease n=1 Tax=Demequina litoralis TaxID=3051660 RepID=A0ABT8G7L3_9MICO|nr:hypothetical protein [Demequina sp. SYSU T00192]MDN4475141.1 hypothetical protein [Demequina sp. SYSU T00192]
MTLGTNTGSATEPRSSFGSVVAGEWFKLRTMRSTLWLIAVFVVLTAAMGATSSAGGDAPTQDDLAARLTAGLSLTLVFPAVLGVVAATSEWSTGLVRVSLVATPRRAWWVMAKAIVVGVVAIVATVCALALTIILSMFRYSGTDLAIDLTSPGTLAVLFGAPAFVAIMTVLSLAVGVLMRHSGGAVAASVGLLIVLPMVMGIFGLPVLVEILPTNAGLALMAQPAPFTPAVAIMLTLLWAAAPLGAGIWALQRRGA